MNEYLISEESSPLKPIEYMTCRKDRLLFDFPDRCIAGVQRTSSVFSLYSYVRVENASRDQILF